MICYQTVKLLCVAYSEWYSLIVRPNKIDMHVNNLSKKLLYNKIIIFRIICSMTEPELLHLSVILCLLAFHWADNCWLM